MRVTVHPLARAWASPAAWAVSLSRVAAAWMLPASCVRLGGRGLVAVVMLMWVVLWLAWWLSGFEFAQVGDVGRGGTVEGEVELLGCRGRLVVAAAEHSSAAWSIRSAAWSVSASAVISWWAACVPSWRGLGGCHAISLVRALAGPCRGEVGRGAGAGGGPVAAPGPVARRVELVFVQARRRRASRGPRPVRSARAAARRWAGVRAGGVLSHHASQSSVAAARNPAVTVRAWPWTTRRTRSGGHVEGAGDPGAVVAHGDQGPQPPHGAVRVDPGRGGGGGQAAGGTAGHDAHSRPP